MESAQHVLLGRGYKAILLLSIQTSPPHPQNPKGPKSKAALPNLQAKPENRSPEISEPYFMNGHE